LFTIDHVAKPVLNTAQTLKDQHFEEPESQQQYLDCILQIWHREVRFFARQMEEYSNETHLSTLMAAIQYSEKFHATDEFNPDFEGKDDDSFSLLQRILQRPPSS
jgi:hypothetical protein